MPTHAQLKAAEIKTILPESDVHSIRSRPEYRSLSTKTSEPANGSESTSADRSDSHLHPNDCASVCVKPLTLLPDRSMSTVSSAGWSASLKVGNGHKTVKISTTSASFKCKQDKVAPCAYVALGASGSKQSKW